MTEVRSIGSRVVHAFMRLRLSFTGLVAAGAFLACAGSLLSVGAAHFWFFELFCHWRLQYALCLLATGLCLLLLRRWKLAVLCAAFGLANASTLVPLFHGPPRAEASDGRFRVTLSNVNTNLGDPRRVLSMIGELDPEIVVLLEISDRWLVDLAPLRESHPHHVEIPRSDNFGIALYSIYPLLSTETPYLPTADAAVSDASQISVPSIVAVIETAEGPITLIATHPVPPPGPAYAAARDDHLEALASMVRMAPPPVILIGDLNTTPWSPHFKRLVRASELLDSARGHGLQPTWPVQNPLLWIPIDHCLHSPDLVVLERSVGPNVGSDHFPLTLDFAACRPHRTSLFP